MPIADLKGARLPATADMHVHLRQGSMMELVVPTIRQGGVDVCYVMPNLQPPITSVAQAVEYRKTLQAIDPNVTYLMSLYLHPEVSSETIIEAKAAGVTGVKLYPAGVTTNSDAGVLDYTTFYPVFAEMERVGMILNIHGECPSTSYVPPPTMVDISEPQQGLEPPKEATTILNAEQHFLPTLYTIHSLFPSLRIVLEHLTTAAAVEAVLQCGPTVAGTITAHHLHITIEDWGGTFNPHNYCKPVAKLPSDRAALISAALSGNPKFFFGSDSAPHPVQAKGTGGKGKVAAGVFTQPFTSQLVLDAFERAVAEGIVADEQVTKDAVRGFLSIFGRRFYDVESDRQVFYKTGRGREGGSVIPNALKNNLEDLEVVPFRAGERTWSLEWEMMGRMGMIL